MGEVVDINSARASFHVVVLTDEVFRTLKKADLRILVQAEEESIDTVSKNIQNQLMYALKAMLAGVEI